MAFLDLISSIALSIFDIGEVTVEEVTAEVNAEEVANEDESRQEPRPLSNVHMPPSQDESSESDEEEELGEEELGISDDYVEVFGVINKDCEYRSGKEYTEESYHRLIVAQNYSKVPIAQSMMGTARFLLPTLPVLGLESSYLLYSESVEDYSDADDSDSWSVIDER